MIQPSLKALRPHFRQFLRYLNPRSNRKAITQSAIIKKTHATSMSSTPELMILSYDTGQRIFSFAVAYLTKCRTWHAPDVLVCVMLSQLTHLFLSCFAFRQGRGTQPKGHHFLTIYQEISTIHGQVEVWREEILGLSLQRQSMLTKVETSLISSNF